MAKLESQNEKTHKEMVEEIAKNIAILSREVTALLSGRLKKSTIVILLAHQTKLPRKEIDLVLDAIMQLETTYLKK